VCRVFFSIVVSPGKWDKDGCWMEVGDLVVSVVAWHSLARWCGDGDDVIELRKWPSRDLINERHLVNPRGL
jgi:hypothetical protein